MMNGRHVILDALDRKRPSRPAVSLRSAGCWTFQRFGYSLQDVAGKAALMADTIVRSNTDVRSDIVWVGSGFHNLAVQALGGQLKWRPRGTPDVKAPLLAGDASQVATALSQFDLGRLAAEPAISALWGATALVRKTIGAETLVGASQWGPFTLAGLLLGVERMMRNMIRDPAEVHRVLAFATELSYAYLSPFAKNGAEILSVAEPTSSGDMVSRKQLEEFTVPYLTRIIRRLKADGSRVIVHICGNITNRLDLLPPTAADLLSVDYTVRLDKVRCIVGPYMAYAGNLNPVAILQQSSPRQVIEAAWAALDQVEGDARYVLMPGCDIPPAVPIENVQALVQAARTWSSRPAQTGVLSYVS
jgi:uroporphyrinogen decarboxylase